MGNNVSKCISTIHPATEFIAVDFTLKQWCAVSAVQVLQTERQKQVCFYTCGGGASVIKVIKLSHLSDVIKLDLT